jgi:hypothetical protein
MGSLKFKEGSQVMIMLERRIPFIFRFEITQKMNHLDWS